MTVAVGDVCRIVAEWTMPDATIAQLVYHYVGVSGSTATSAQMGGAVLAQLQSAWLAIDQDVDDEVLGNLLETYQWDFTLHQWDGIDSRAMTSLDGLLAGSIMPHGNAGLVKIITKKARRQCRKYVPGLTEAGMADAFWTNPVIVNLASFAGVLDNDITAGGLTLSFCSFNSDPASPLYETTSTANGTVIAEGIPAYQRRRRPGTGI